MISVRRSNERGHEDHGWLDTHHTFSFAGYHDPRFMGFRALRVLNEDRVKPGYGFSTHRHDNMEILSYVVSGALEHKDSLGTGSVIRPGDVQRITAGTGVSHSEFNPSPSDPVHFLQIWLFPEQRGLEPGYEQKTFAPDLRRNTLRLAASSDGADGSIRVRQDVRLYASLLDAAHRVELNISPERHAWIQVVRGALRVNGEALGDGDGAAVSRERGLSIEAERDAEFLAFDLA